MRRDRFIHKNSAINSSKITTITNIGLSGVARDGLLPHVIDEEGAPKLLKLTQTDGEFVKVEVVSPNINASTSTPPANQDESSSRRSDHVKKTASIPNIDTTSYIDPTSDISPLKQMIQSEYFKQNTCVLIRALFAQYFHNTIIVDLDYGVFMPESSSLQNSSDPTKMLITEVIEDNKLEDYRCSLFHRSKQSLLEDSETYGISYIMFELSGSDDIIPHELVIECSESKGTLISYNKYIAVKSNNLRPRHLSPSKVSITSSYLFSEYKEASFGDEGNCESLKEAKGAIESLCSQVGWVFTEDISFLTLRNLFKQVYESMQKQVGRN